VWLPLLLLFSATAQDRVKPLDPEKGRTKYEFPVVPGGKPFRFHVRMDKEGNVTGVDVFRPGEAAPFQNLPACKDDISEPFSEYDDERDLLEHDDMNFDGFEDIELLQFFHPHLGTKIYCIYTWDNKAARFRHAPDIPNMNPVANPETKTITVHQDLQGGVYSDKTYRLMAGKFELTDESGRVYGSDNSKCGFTDYCNKLINGKMVTTLWRPVVCSDNREDPDLVCPVNPKGPARNAPKPRPSTPVKH
jgi:hypothetical protein